MAKRSLGMGTVYRRMSHRSGAEMPIWWVSYNIAGKQYRESTRTTDHDEAVQYLRRKLGKVADGGHVDKTRGRLLVRDLMMKLVARYEAKGRASLPTVRGIGDRWNEAAGDVRAVDLTTERVQRIVAGWRKQRLAGASINRRLAALRHAFKLAKLLIDPSTLDIGDLWQREAPPRETVVDVATFDRIVSKMPPVIAAATEFAFVVGIRRGQVVATKWENVDRNKWVVRWTPDQTKQRKEQRIALAGRALDLMQARWRARKPGSQYVFELRVGEKIHPDTISKAWNAACEDAGVKAGRDGGVTLHDLRRSAITAAMDSGTAAHVAMSLSGHATRAMLDRYSIALEDQQRAALERTSAVVAAARSSAARKAKVVDLARHQRRT
jgi:integrase